MNTPQPSIFENETGDRADGFSCQLTTAQFRERKATVLIKLKQAVLERQETMTGFAFTFPGSDDVLDQLVDFVKTERACCSFLSFNIAAGDNKKNTRLEITGPPGAKDFISEKLGL